MDNPTNKTWLDQAQSGANLLSGTLVALYLRKVNRLPLAFPLITAGGIAMKRKLNHKGICLGAAAGLALRGLTHLRGAINVARAATNFGQRFGALATPVTQGGWGTIVLGAHFIAKPTLRQAPDDQPDVDGAIATLKSFSDHKETQGAKTNNFSGLRLSDDGKTVEVDKSAGSRDLAVAVANLFSADLWEAPYLTRRYESGLVQTKLKQSADALLTAPTHKVVAKRQSIEGEVKRFNALLFPQTNSHYASFVGTTNRTFAAPIAMNFRNPELRAQSAALADAMKAVGGGSRPASSTSLALPHQVLTPLQEAYGKIAEASLGAQEAALCATYERTADQLGQKRAKFMRLSARP